MRDFQTFKRSAVRYWERRRIPYNLALLLPAFVGYGVTDTLNWVGDDHERLYAYIIPWFAASALGANVCYSLVYVLEFFFGSEDPASRWLRSGRTATFVFGLLLSMVLALVGGGNIAMMEWQHGFRRIQ